MSHVWQAEFDSGPLLLHTTAATSAKPSWACLTVADGCSPKNGEKRKRALSGASLAAAMANHPHVLFDDEGVGRSPRSVAAKARYCPGPYLSGVRSWRMHPFLTDCRQPTPF